MSATTLRTGLVLLAALVLSSACRRRDETPLVANEPVPSRLEIWNAIQPLAQRYQIAPSLIYALVAAESNFDPRARNGENRGLLQLSPDAWRLVSSKPYETDVWHWRENLEAGIDYLAYLRSDLHRHHADSNEVLLGAFHYGLGFVADRDFDSQKIPVPDSPIYRKLWAGDLAPVAAP